VDLLLFVCCSTVSFLNSAVAKRTPVLWSPRKTPTEVLNFINRINSRCTDTYCGSRSQRWNLNWGSLVHINIESNYINGDVNLIAF
jgi:hypothetical protein